MTIRELSTAEFSSEVLNASVPVLVDFWASWCQPCRAVAPVIEALAHEHAGKMAVFKVNIDEQPELAAKHGIRSIPFFKIYVRGETVMEFSGARPKSDFDSLLTTIID
ncbi:thioredoxin [Leclercia sp. UBA7405]|uniref:thioredoxin n=1 Tax=Leclercia sp. UBA7405 TaxID=1946743 RepID=UPI003018FF26